MTKWQLLETLGTLDSTFLREAEQNPADSGENVAGLFEEIIRNAEETPPAKPAEKEKPTLRKQPETAAADEWQPEEPTRKRGIRVRTATVAAAAFALTVLAGVGAFLMRIGREESSVLPASSQQTTGTSVSVSEETEPAGIVNPLDGGGALRCLVAEGSCPWIRDDNGTYHYDVWEGTPSVFEDDRYYYFGTKRADKQNPSPNGVYTLEDICSEPGCTHENCLMHTAASLLCDGTDIWMNQEGGAVRLKDGLTIPLNKGTLCTYIKRLEAIDGFLVGISLENSNSVSPRLWTASNPNHFTYLALDENASLQISRMDSETVRVWENEHNSFLTIRTGFTFDGIFTGPYYDGKPVERVFYTCSEGFVPDENGNLVSQGFDYPSTYMYMGYFADNDNPLTDNYIVTNTTIWPETGLQFLGKDGNLYTKKQQEEFGTYDRVFQETAVLTESRIHYTSLRGSGEKIFGIGTDDDGVHALWRSQTSSYLLTKLLDLEEGWELVNADSENAILMKNGNIFRLYNSYTKEIADFDTAPLS